MQGWYNCERTQWWQAIPIHKCTFFTLQAASLHFDSHFLGLCLRLHVSLTLLQFPVIPGHSHDFQLQGRSISIACSRHLWLPWCSATHSAPVSQSSHEVQRSSGRYFIKVDQTIIHANNLLHRPQLPRLLFFHSDKFIGYEFQLNPRHINEKALALSTTFQITLLETHVFNLGVIAALHYNH